MKNTADGVASTVTGAVDVVAAIPETAKSTAEAVAAVPEKIGNAVDSAVATACAVAAVPGKIADGAAGFSAWLQSVLPKACRSSGRRPTSSGRRNLHQKRSGAG